MSCQDDVACERQMAQQGPVNTASAVGRLFLTMTSDAEDPSHFASYAACRADLASLRQVVSDLRALPDPPDALIETAKADFRRRRSIEALIERLIEDPALRQKARSRPESVLRDAGLEPDPDLVEALRELDRPSGDLARRIAAKSFLR